MDRKAQNSERLKFALERLPDPFNAEVDAHVLLLCDIVRETAFGLQHYLGPGHLEKVYETGMLHRLNKVGIEAERQAKLIVHDDDGHVLGEYFADILVRQCLIVELKAADTLSKTHVAQVMGYLAATRMRHGLLLNFGTIPLGIRKLIH